MIEEYEARRRILDITPKGEVLRIPLSTAVGYRLAEKVSGRVDLPGFDNSAMDGYAVRASDATITGATLSVIGEQPAGEWLESLEISEGEAIRIFTGAAIPRGADAVIMQEDVTRQGDSIVVNDPVVSGEFIRRRGGDVCAGQQLFSAGQLIDPATVGVLASQGIGEIAVHAGPRVAVVSTGDELVSPEVGRVLKPGQIYNSNGVMLSALALQFGAAEVQSFHAADDPQALSGTLEDALQFGDVVLIAGGVSVGEKDFVKQSLAERGVVSDFWKVRVKPGKPFLFGRREETLVFGLPGNPVSAYVTFLLFAAPAMRRWQGAPIIDSIPLPRVKRTLAEDLRNYGDRPHYIRVKINEAGQWQAVGRQESHALFGLSRADALLRMDGDQDLAAGEIAEGFLLKS